MFHGGDSVYAFYFGVNKQVFQSICSKLLLKTGVSIKINWDSKRVC